MFPEARHDDQVDSTVQYLQWMRKINTSAFRVRDFGPNPTWVAESSEINKSKLLSRRALFNSYPSPNSFRGALL